LLLNLIICFSPVLHPITFYLAQEESPITNGRTDYAVILYTAQILHHISLLFLHTKFFILVVERALAYRQRKVYENARNSYVLQMMVVTLLLCLLEISSKLLAYAIISSEDNVDVWLSKAFTVEKSPSYFLFTYSLSACSGLVGYVCDTN
uniref:G_PROTEIN_RECEP_F1_2 domain-containing protein n=1 Tax=Bursaphelenchus xylophilus TaxID=6326 RepID=A0A1I7SN81_BURXY